MATAVSLLNMSSFNNACVDPDVDTYFDFNTIPSPTPTTSSHLPASTAGSAITSPATTLLPLDQTEDQQTPQKPSHEYERFKQQTGLPSNSVPGIHGSSQIPAQYTQVPFSNSGISFDDMGFLGGSSLDAGWNSGLGMGSDVNMELDLTSPSSSLPPYFFPPSTSTQPDNFINPSAITTPEEPQPNLRVWPGMHQQAALAKAQAQAQQQRQQQLLQQQQQQKQRAAEQNSRSQSARRSASHQPLDARTEETIARVVNQIRKSSMMPQNAVANIPSAPVPAPSHTVRTKKDEEEMDEDERLLASEEGKKLSSKERRQLRNKVSARAFRSRRKEYISQLEGEVAAKAAENNELRIREQGLVEENARCRKFIENLLRHPAFVPFLEDISRDPVLTEPTQVQRPVVPATTPIRAPASTLKDVNPFAVSPQQVQESSFENPQIGMALIPETPIDMSMLTLSNNWGVANGLNLSSFQQPQVYAVMEVPEGPENPLDTDVLSGKGLSALLSPPSTVEEVKADYPVIETPSISESEPESTGAESISEVEPEEYDPEMELYLDLPSTSPNCPASLDDSKFPVAKPVSEKDSHQFELFMSDEADTERLMESLDRLCSRFEPVVQRLMLYTSHLDA